MLRILVLGVLFLGSALPIHASFLTTEPSLRALRAQLIKKPVSLQALVVAGMTQMAKIAHESSQKTEKFSKEELEKMSFTICAEEAKDHTLAEQTNAWSLIGKKVMGSVCEKGKSVTDVHKITRMGYTNTSSFERGTLVIVSQEDRCYYGIIVGKNAHDSYRVQVDESHVVSINTGDIASK